MILGKGEDNRNGLQLGDDEQAIRVGRVNNISDIDEPQPDPAADRRSDVRINELQLGVINLCLVGFDRAFELTHLRLLGVELLARNYAFFEQQLVALVVDLNVLELGLILGKLPFGLLQLYFERPRIDFDERVDRKSVV